MKTDIKKLPHAEAEIEVIIPHDDLIIHKKAALDTLRESLTIDGFRKGAAPDTIVESHAGTMGLYTEMAYAAIAKAYGEIIKEYKLDAIGNPKIVIKKLAPGNDLEATITTALMPEITLADYKKIAKETLSKKEESSVTDEEFEQAVKELRQMRAHDKMHEDGVEHHSHNHREIPDTDLPPVDEEFVKKVGGFESVEEFNTKLRENLKTEKERRADEKVKIEMIDAIIARSTIDLPHLLIDLEIDRIMERTAHDVSMMGMSFDEYLKRVNKTRDDMRAQWRDQAATNAKTTLVLDEIAKIEKLDPTKEEVEAEANKVLGMYEDRKDIDPMRVEAYVTTMLRNQNVFKFLEGKK